MPASTWHGAASLEALLAGVEELHVHPGNARRGDVAGIATSLNRFGQMRPIVAQLDGTILAGNHTYRAATEVCGWDRIAVVRVNVAADEAEAYLVADNRWGDLGRYDDTLLAEQLARLADAGQLDGIGWTADEVDDLLAQLDMMAETAREGFEGGYAEPDGQFDERARRLEDHRESPVPQREVPLVMLAEQYALFSDQVRYLAAAWNVAGVTEVCLRAVAEAHARAAT